MEQTVYADLFFLVNFSMDFLCLYLTAKLLHRTLAIGRALLGATLGGLYAVIALFLPLSEVFAFAADALVGLLICAATFARRRTPSRIWLCFLSFLGISMALGGFMTALFYLLNRSPLAELAEIEGDGISIWIFAILACISGAVTLLGGRFFGKQSAYRSAQVEISLGGKLLHLHALADSGNLLCEPMTGKPCILVDTDAIAPILPAELLHAARLRDPLRIGSVSRANAKRICLIPTQTATGSGMLLGIRPDRICVDCGKGARQVDAVLAISSLSSSAAGHDALLPSVLLIS